MGVIKDKEIQPKGDVFEMGSSLLRYSPFKSKMAAITTYSQNTNV
jgi:hypothetical protein